MTVPIAELPRAGLAPAAARSSTPAFCSAVAAVALQICYPLVHESTRDRLTAAVVVTFAMAAALHAAGCIGVARGLTVVAISVGIGFVAEVVGVHSGIPFGSYRYADSLGPRLAGVPIIVGLAWAMMAWPAAVVARRLARTRISQVVIGAWALASWDLFLDPQMVAAGHWTWREPTPHLPGVPTVPLTNLLGWLVVSAVVSLAGQYIVGLAFGTAGRPDACALPLDVCLLDSRAHRLLRTARRRAVGRARNGPCRPTTGGDSGAAPMTAWPSLVRIGTGLAMLGTAHTALNAELLRSLRNGDGSVSRCAVSILVPARDEAPNIAACLLSLLAQDVRPAAKIIILDDGSCDGTADIARAVAGADSRVRIMTGQPVPPTLARQAVRLPPTGRRGSRLGCAGIRRCRRSARSDRPSAWRSACWIATTSTSSRHIHARSRAASQSASSSHCCSGRG